MNRRFIMKVLGLILIVMTFTMCKNHTVSVPSTPAPEEALGEQYFFLYYSTFFKLQLPIL